jgi:hypothetical protein
MTLVRRRQDIGLRVLAGAPPHIVVGAASLPSGDAAIKLVRGDSGAVVEVASTMLLRGALVALGLAVAGFRGMQILTGSAAAVMAIEAGVLVWAYRNKERA